MTIVEMLGQSITLTLLGMGVVFGFLIILIVCMTLVKKIIQALKLDVVETKTSSASVQANASATNAVIAAIAVALKDKN